jgi:hypothetical protein
VIGNLVRFVLHHLKTPEAQGLAANVTYYAGEDS